MLCLLVPVGVEGLTCSAPLALPQRWAGATEALPRVLLPRGGGRAGTIVSAASDDTTPSLPLEEQASRTKEMLEAEDYAGAAIESAAALEVLPDLADVARMRGRALLDPLLDKMLEGAVLDNSEFGEAYEAFRLAAVMDPENGEEARMELVRIEELCKRLPGEVETVADAVPDSGQSAPNQGSLRFEIGARVECRQDPPGRWNGGTVVGRFYREPEWPPGEVAPYQVQLDDDGPLRPRRLGRLHPGRVCQPDRRGGRWGGRQVGRRGGAGCDRRRRRRRRHRLRFLADPYLWARSLARAAARARRRDRCVFQVRPA